MGQEEVKVRRAHFLSHSENPSFLSKGEKCRSFIDLAPASEKGKRGPAQGCSPPVFRHFHAQVAARGPVRVSPSANLAMAPGSWDPVAKVQVSQSVKWQRKVILPSLSSGTFLTVITFCHFRGTLRLCGKRDV